jgi:hypothetical protein
MRTGVSRLIRQCVPRAVAAVLPELRDSLKILYLLVAENKTQAVKLKLE